MPEYLAVVLTIFLIVVGLSFMWVCFWISIYLTNRVTHKD
jgi:hypothetical protein